MRILYIHNQFSPKHRHSIAQHNRIIFCSYNSGHKPLDNFEYKSGHTHCNGNSWPSKLPNSDAAAYLLNNHSSVYCNKFHHEESFNLCLRDSQSPRQFEPSRKQHYYASSIVQLRCESSKQWIALRLCQRNIGHHTVILNLYKRLNIARNQLSLGPSHFEQLYTRSASNCLAQQFKKL